MRCSTSTNQVDLLHYSQRLVLKQEHGVSMVSFVVDPLCWWWLLAQFSAVLAAPSRKIKLQRSQDQTTPHWKKIVASLESVIGATYFSLLRCSTSTNEVGFTEGWLCLAENVTAVFSRQSNCMKGESLSAKSYQHYVPDTGVVTVI